MLPILPKRRGGNPRVFEWFAAQGESVLQLALGWDTGSGDASSPALQLLMARNDADATCGFLEVAGRPDAADSYRAFLKRMPNGWFACYTGVFPTRPDPRLRVECIPRRELQKAYAQDAKLLEEHLRQIGFNGLGTTLVSRCCKLAALPFRLEFQFDVDADGMSGSTFGASLRFARPPPATRTGTRSTLSHPSSS